MTRFAERLAAFVTAKPTPDAAACEKFADYTTLAVAGWVVALIELYEEQRDGMPQTGEWKAGFGAGMTCVANTLLAAGGPRPPAQTITVTDGIASGEEVTAL